MGIDPRRYPNPAAGYHRIASERRFMWIEQDPDSVLREKWLKHAVTCPVCGTDAGLVLVYEEGDMFVQVLCPSRHEWPELLVNPAHFVAYSELRFHADPNPALLWVIDAGFGEEPVVIDDHVEEIVKGAKAIAKYGKRKARTRIRGAVRRPMRRAKKKALNFAFAPVAAALRAAWIVQSGGVPQQTPGGGKKAGGKGRGQAGVKIPSVAAYRKALGVPAPQKGPACLVCEDTGRITGPGVSIPCTECNGAADVLARAEAKAQRVREGGRRADSGNTRKAAASRKTGASRKSGASPGRTRSTISNQGVIVGPGETVTGPVSVTGATTGPGSKTAKRTGKAGATPQANPAGVDAAAREAARPGVRIVTGVVNVGNGRITGSVQETNLPSSHQQINVRNDGHPPVGGRPPTAAEAAAAREARQAADQALRDSGGRSATTVHVTGKNNSVITTTTDGDATHVTGGD
ncbi:hypothetical protein [Streptomyces sp. NPDC004230]